MNFIYSLCSSSKGNATYIGNKQNGILIDVGISLRGLKNQLLLNDIELSSIKGIFLTHEHTDHIKGLKTVCSKLNLPVFGSKKTLDAVIKKGLISPHTTLEAINNKTTYILDMQVDNFDTPHDSSHSLGYQLKFENGKKACICTDLGCVTDIVYQNLKDSDLVLLESNYDENMLKYGDYPRMLKERILSSTGHLSNIDCAKTINRLFNDGTTRFILGHLSENNNLPELAFKESLQSLTNAGGVINKDYILAVAKCCSLGETILI